MESRVAQLKLPKLESQYFQLLSCQFWSVRDSLGDKQFENNDKRSILGARKLCSATLTQLTLKVLGLIFWRAKRG